MLSTRERLNFAAKSGEVSARPLVPSETHGATREQSFVTDDVGEVRDERHRRNAFLKQIARHSADTHAVS